MEEKTAVARNQNQIVFRILAVVFALLGWFMLMGLSEGLEPWIPGGLGAAVGEEMRFFGAVHGALIGILFNFSLLAMLRRPLEKPLLLRFYIVGHVLFLVTLAATDPSLALQRAFVFILFAIVMTSLYAAYGKRREMVKPAPPLRRNRGMLVMAVLATIGLLPFLVLGVIGQFQETELQFRWGEGAALSVVMMYGGFLAADGRPGSRALGLILAAAYLYLGAASLAVPGHPGSWGLSGGAAAIGYGLALGAVTLRTKPAATSESDILGGHPQMTKELS
ncbi:hypothetical protein [Paenibacillus sp. 1P07SE]|uniref:hypothetical protein n=1 Tax=Paenibacillus sp. 1P07SE TaxID=3132209 RepID=UPI0039A6E535